MREAGDFVAIKLISKANVISEAGDFVAIKLMREANVISEAGDFVAIKLKSFFYFLLKTKNK
jgi:hypothetical protein